MPTVPLAAALLEYAVPTLAVAVGVAKVIVGAVMVMVRVLVAVNLVGVPESVMVKTAE